MHDLEGKFLSLNRAGENLLGYNLKDTPDLSVFDIVPEEYWPGIKDYMQWDPGNRRSITHELEIINRAGQRIPLENCPHIVMRDGKPHVVQGIARNISKRKQAEMAWKESEQRLHSIINFLPDATFVIDIEGRVIHWNLAMEEMTGIKAEHMVGRGQYEYALPFYGERCPILIDEILEQYQQQSMHSAPAGPNSNVIIGEQFCPNIGPEGARLFGKASTLFDVNGKVTGAIESIRDVTARWKTEAALRSSEENFRTLAALAPAMIFVIQKRKVIYVNNAAETITGYTRDELLALSPLDIVHSNYRQRVLSAFRTSPDKIKRLQFVLAAKHGKDVWLDLSTTMVEFDGQPSLLGVAVDITKDKEAENEIRYLSYHDKLTGLFNRAYCEEMMNRFAEPQYMPLSMIVGDLNGLKLINDAFGHHTGDLLLKGVAEVMQRFCRSQDIVARWGGDEFVMLLPNTDEIKAARIGAGIRTGCLEVPGLPVQASISLGISARRDLEQSVEELSKEAEDRMYRAKLLDSKSNRSHFMQSLENALEMRSHETQVHTERLSRLVEAMGQALALPSAEIHNLILLAKLHDIGKIAIPSSVLEKPEPLTAEEWELMKKHTEIGYRIALSSPELSMIAEAILTHHERWDGTGYPLKLKAEEIPLPARVLSIADAYDVMISGRLYQQAVSCAEALQEISRCAGTQFDPELARRFIDLVKYDLDIRAEARGL